MFIGEFKHNIDEKGRLAIPVKFRSDLAKGAVVTRGLDDCLFVYTLEEWEKLANKLSNLPISQAKARAFARLMLAGAMDVVPDKQGRINLPEYLRQYAGLKKEVIVAGLYNRFLNACHGPIPCLLDKTYQDNSTLRGIVVTSQKVGVNHILRVFTRFRLARRLVTITSAYPDFFRTYKFFRQPHRSTSHFLITHEQESVKRS